MISLKLDDGRELALEAVTPYEAMGIAEGCRQLSGVRQWWRMAMTVGSVRSIDGIPLPLPTHEKHIEGMVARFCKRDLKAISVALELPVSADISLDLEFSELTPLETLRVWALIGEFETIAGWVAPAFIAAAVRKIDDEKVSFPSSKQDMKILVSRLGPIGMHKASDFMLRQANVAKAAEADREAAAKN